MYKCVKNESMYLNLSLFQRDRIKISELSVYIDQRWLNLSRPNLLYIH